MQKDIRSTIRLCATPLQESKAGIGRPVGWNNSEISVQLAQN